MYLLKGFVTVDPADSAASKHQTELGQLHQQNFSWIGPRYSSNQSHEKLSFHLHLLCQSLMPLVGKICATAPIDRNPAFLCAAAKPGEKTLKLLRSSARPLQEAVGDPILSRLLES